MSFRYRIVDTLSIRDHTRADYRYDGVFVCTSFWCPSNNRALEYTNRHSIRAVDRGSYRNLLYSREVARGSDGDEKGETRGWGYSMAYEEGKRTGDRKRLDEWRQCCWWWWWWLLAGRIQPRGLAGGTVLTHPYAVHRRRRGCVRFAESAIKCIATVVFV